MQTKFAYTHHNKCLVSFSLVMAMPFFVSFSFDRKRWGLEPWKFAKEEFECWDQIYFVDKVGPVLIQPVFVLYHLLRCSSTRQSIALPNSFSSFFFFIYNLWLWFADKVMFFFHFWAKQYLTLDFFTMINNSCVPPNTYHSIMSKNMSQQLIILTRFTWTFFYIKFMKSLILRS